MDIKLFNYKLPKELIAQEQKKPRDHSRLLILDRASSSAKATADKKATENKKPKIAHKHFYDLPDYLTENDVLVVNETKVFPARLYGQKKTGGQVEILLTERIDSKNWQAMIGGRNLKVGDFIYFDPLIRLRTGKKLECQIIKDIDGKTKQIKFNKSGQALNKIIEQIGHTPLPPYIKTIEDPEQSRGKDSQKIKQDYQTVYAKIIGSAAAPTAGLHFTNKILKQLEKQGVQIFKVTLHVSLGTFAPVEVEDIEKHKIHHEWASIDKKTASSLNKLKKAGKNIIAVGTTSARTLEAFSARGGSASGGTKNYELQPSSKWVEIYIYPGYQWKFIDDLITNFHLPKSSLLFMVSALASRELILKAYKKAVDKKYRFFSFGDAMFVKHSSAKTKPE
ncbi:tRNA preQ1(34) S-adenosylmethionine ribosyltransferase-isomerase QueA [bacterium]|nr:tRNA preQ1(34) S-adenosylmethionine ribosyltransferase-isomerase QueA [bacterium]